MQVKNRLGILCRNWSFYQSAGTIYNRHSPFLYDFYKNVYRGSISIETINILERYRKEWLSNSESIQITDLGAGSSITHSKTRQIKSIAFHSFSSKNQARLLYNLCLWLDANVVLELGTSLGLATAYMSKAIPDGKIYTIEGDPVIHKLANSFFKSEGLSNIISLYGDNRDVCPKVVAEVVKIDLVFLDGNHQYGATIDYFDMVLPKIHEGSCIIVDDVFWSEGMYKAWTELKSHPSVESSILLYDFGLLFFKPRSTVGPHLEIVPSWTKPWTWLKMI